MTENRVIGVAGPAATFERECERLRPLGEAYVLRRFGGQLNHADAEDAVAEVLIRLHQRAARGETPENLRAAFFTSVRNAAIDQLRARGARPTVALDAANGLAADGAAPIEYAETREESAVLAEALAGMRRNYREALLMRFGIGLTIPEIAERRGITLNAAKKLVLRGTRQAKRRLLDVTSEAHCEEMQTLAKRQLVEKYLAEMASEQEVAELEKHLEHCGRCKSLVMSLHQGLHDAASGLVVAGGVGDYVAEKAGLASQLSDWLSAAHDHAQLAAEKARLVAFKTSGAVQGGDAATGGLLAGGSQKIVALCATGAAAATCVGAGVVGPGVAGVDVIRGDNQAAHEKPAPGATREPATTATSTPVPTTTQTAEQPQAEPVQTNPVQQVDKELYGGGSTSGSSGSTSGSRDFAAPVGSSSTSGGGGGGSSGGSRENFGP
jgi:RNA polymerase sigma factor (sigma-70 family)